jgi:hypothetical protein
LEELLLALCLLEAANIWHVLEFLEEFLGLCIASEGHTSGWALLSPYTTTHILMPQSVVSSLAFFTRDW